MGHGLAPQQGADDVGAFLQTRVALRLLGPSNTRQILVEPLAAAESEPEPTGKHLAQGGGTLGQDGRMVAVAWGGDDAEGQLGRLEGGAEPGPGIARMALRWSPGAEMVRGH